MGDNSMPRCPSAMGLKEMEELVKKLKYYVGCGYDMYPCLLRRYPAQQVPVPKLQQAMPMVSGPWRTEPSSMLVKAIKEAYGKDFLVEMQVSGERRRPHHFEDIVTFAKLAEGLHHSQ